MGSDITFQRKRGFYEKFIKRIFDIVCSLAVLIAFSWLYLFIALAVWIKMGSPILFRQPRPGQIKNGREQIFNMYKFRTMTNDKDADGKLLPDEKRLPPFGKWLRSTSLDELPEIFNIILNDMSLIGPRPQLVRDMVFMSDKVRMRHTVKPGLTGLAQVNGRNAITWEERFAWDLRYIENISFANDVKILWQTIRKVLGRSESKAELDITFDYGDWLLNNKKISNEEYLLLQNKAAILVN